MQPLKPAKPNLDVFSETLLELAREDPDILVVTSDSRGSARLANFARALPERVIEIGIAEQNLVGVSAGLASAGKKVFAVSPASFLTARGFEQIKNDVAYSNQPVKLVGISAGVSYGSLGSTHHSTHDLAVLMAIHNIDIVIPADNYETREAIRAAAAYPQPLYLRFGKKPMPECLSANTDFVIGKAIRLASGSDVTLVATGETVWPAWEAREILEAQGVSCGVLDVHTLRPLDTRAIAGAAQTSKVMVTVEEHSVHGGLGSLVASFLMQAGLYLPLRIVGLPDEPIVTGSQNEVFAHYGISAEGLSAAAQELLQRASLPAGKPG
ncbi:MAG TPA: transketolase C-terminal domain-containing protein [Anaerolineaceae bacterium]|nr:transketolase C-terminal domain-containing protein [Anaerolineaceae bacterium]